MNNIKFRFGINNKVYNVYKIDFIEEEVEFNQNGFVSIASLNKGELLRWTGIKDKYNKDIYEGDIVRTLGWGTKEEITEIVWQDEDVCFNIHYYLNAEDCDFETEDIEIIGNKFENPELLEEE